MGWVYTRNPYIGKRVGVSCVNPAAVKSSRYYIFIPLQVLVVEVGDFFLSIPASAAYGLTLAGTRLGLRFDSPRLAVIALLADFFILLFAIFQFLHLIAQ